jgi:aryl-alcohol dehydrogenase-like predicted oxidoreductase
MELSRIVIGGTRFNNRERGGELLHFTIDCDFNYIDTSPCCCYSNETKNSEVWVGEAINHPVCRDRVG